ncbi:hypothetical protein C8R43DRAFT_1138138 [Mycena crocata]|nr:hypothetical protein C8R43DRAFT_1138138 [Mycena crocata]
MKTHSIAHHDWPLHGLTQTFAPTLSQTQASIIAGTPVSSAEAALFNSHRRVCRVAYYPEDGVDHIAHSQNSGTKFYVVCPGRVECIYTCSLTAECQVKGFRNGKMQSAFDWDEALAEWRKGCARRHGTQCEKATAKARVSSQSRIHLMSAPERARGEFWAIKGIEDVFESLAGAINSGGS